MYEIPGSLRVLKGLIFLYATAYLINARWRDKLKYLIPPLSLVVVHHTVVVSAKLLDLSWADAAIASYKAYFIYYTYYWILCLVLSIFLLIKHRKTINHAIANNFRYLFVLYPCQHSHFICHLLFFIRQNTISEGLYPDVSYSVRVDIVRLYFNVQVQAERRTRNYSAIFRVQGNVPV